MDWNTSLPADLAAKLTAAGWPKDDQRIQIRIKGFQQLDFMKVMLAAVPTLTMGEAGELLGWANIPPSQYELVNPVDSGLMVETRQPRSAKSGGATLLSAASDSSELEVSGSGASLRGASALAPPAAQAPIGKDAAAPTVDFNTEHCLGGVLNAMETLSDSVCSGLASPARTVARVEGEWQIHGKGGRRAAAQKERERSGDGSGSETEALCNSLLQVDLKASPPPPEEIDAKLKMKAHCVDWSCSMDAVSKIERGRQGTHCVVVSMLAENYGLHADFKGIRSAVKRLLRGLVSVATGTVLNRGNPNFLGERLLHSRAVCMCTKLYVHGYMDFTTKNRRKMSDLRFFPDDLEVEGERKILAEVQGLRDLFGGDRVYVSSEDWAVLSEELRKVKPFERDEEKDETLSLGLPSMYVRIARGVLFGKGDRRSFSDFEVSKFVPTSATPGGSFAQRVREYFRVHYHQAGPRGGPATLKVRKS
uniref:Uncharacterized protein n=1 Tax=Chromera velia CCMP2878 TaxID=1169474 RepID=A0A0G4GT97_9ALVE|eukprot:Cvel_23315.t1-p1 / transcript=Cvel_23315.t1 / gene=Cvel_23315 / organism=Chromera_velia_CCMP2878 / gene_product=hypothetical protein / transcript_product=hypothetical protein / location=Cvel_scaffold2388:3136-4563(+) / protein_length=476 / sequence_SO=supercontig / SO=protein_coding / is_pseudo=false